MASSAFVVAMAIGVLFMASFASAVNTVVTSKDCSSENYQEGTAYANSVATVLNDMLTTTANSPGFERKTKAGNPNSQAFGHSTCRNGLSINDCSTCISLAVSLIQGNCGMSVNAKLETPDCTIVYGNSKP